jgi:hypothetical protein
MFNYKNFFLSIIFLSIVFVNLHIFKNLKPGKIDLYTIILCSIAFGSISTFLIKFFFKELSPQNINSMIFFKLKSLETNKIQTKLYFFFIFIIFFISYFYISYVEKNQLNYLFYEISTRIELYKPFKFIKNFLSASLYTASVISFFLILKFFKINKYLSIFLIIIFLSSQTHLANLIVSPFRDYIKAPIVIILIFCFLNLLFFEKIDEKNFKLYILLTSLLLCLGLLVRNDLLIFHILFLGLYSLLFIKNIFVKKFNNNLFYKSFGIYFVINFGHVATVYMFLDNNLALPATFLSTVNEELFITNPGYDSGHIFLDEYIRLLVSYDKDYLFNNIIFFPYDFLIKIYMSMFNVLNFSFKNVLPPIGLENNFFTKIYLVRYYLINFFEFKIVFIFLISCAFLIINHGFNGYVFLGIIFFLLIYPVIQHSIKHYFYLEVINLWSIGYFVQSTLNLKKI